MGRWAKPRTAPILLTALALLASCGSPTVTPVAQRPANLQPRQFDTTSQCLSALFSAGASFQRIEDFRDSQGCGIDSAITLFGTGSGITLAPPADVTCDTAYALTSYIDQTVAPIAVNTLNQPVTEIENYGSYSCRYRAAGKLSEHAKGRALDISGFRLADGSLISVENDWRGSGARTDYLRTVANAACNHVSLVLGPSHDRAHRNHLHLDMGEWALCDP